MSRITLGQLRAFWAVAHSPSLTRAAKQLGVTQPSLSQQLAKLEATLGARLLERSGGSFRLTEAGSFLLTRAETILAEVAEAEVGLGEFATGQRGKISVGGLSSVARALLPEAWARTRAAIPGLELDLHELSPREALDQLYGRNLHVALLSAESLAGQRHSFTLLPIAADPQVLAVPERLDLARITAPERELDAAAQALLNRCILFNFGTPHTQRVEAWWRRVLPHHAVAAQCRTYDTALALVEAGLGVALVPLLTAQHGDRLTARVRIYESGLPARQIVAVVPAHYPRVRPYDLFLRELQAVGQALRLLRPLPMPPFLRMAESRAAEQAALP